MGWKDNDMDNLYDLITKDVRLNKLLKKTPEKEKKALIEKFSAYQTTKSIIRKREERYEKDSETVIAYLETIYQGLFLYNEFILKKYNLELPLCLETFDKALNQVIGYKIDAYHENQKIGLFCQILWLFGSSKNQAYLATADWFKCSESKVKNALKTILNNDDNDFIINLWSDPNYYINKSSKIPFPLFLGSYPKAKRAYDDFLYFHEKFGFLQTKHLNIKKYIEIKEYILINFPNAEKKVHFLF